MDRLETALAEERGRRAELEALRAAFVQRFSQPFVANLEREVLMHELGLTAKQAAELPAKASAGEAHEALTRARPAL